MPYPFTKGVFICGEPIYVDPRADAARMEAARVELENALNGLTARADGFFSKS